LEERTIYIFQGTKRNSNYMTRALSI